MPLTHRIDTRECTLYVGASGVVLHAELLALRRRILGDPHLRPELSWIVDLREVVRVEVSGAQLRDLAGSRPARPLTSDETRVAVLTSDDEVFGLLRMFQQARTTTPETTEVFGDPAAARRWLGLSVRTETSRREPPPERG